MTDASVVVNNLSLNQSSVQEVERVALFIGVGDRQVGDIVSLSASSKVENELGSSQFALNVKAAQVNGGDNWQAYALPILSPESWLGALTAAMDIVSPEFVVFTTPVTSAENINAVNTAMESLRTTYARRCIALQATSGLDEGNESWADYESSQIKLQDGIAADRVALVPLLHQNDIGVLAGRLCRHEVSIADSPQRTKTGSVLGLGVSPADKDGVPLRDSTLKSLRINRLNCIKRYTDYDGTYWGNFNLLTAEGSDYKNGEWLRLVDKAARRVRLLAIGLIDDRSINSQKISQDYTKTVLMRPLIDMSRAVNVGGRHFPGEIVPPAGDSIVLNWVNKTSLEVYITLKPLDAPKKISANILLDLANPV